MVGAIAITLSPERKKVRQSSRSSRLFPEPLGPISTFTVPGRIAVISITSYFSDVHVFTEFRRYRQFFTSVSF